jgi:hypothetical protein
MPALSEAQLVELIRRHHARVLAVRAATAAAVARAWDAVQPVGDVEADEFVRRVVPVVNGAQRSVSSSTAGMLALATGARGPVTNLFGALLRNSVAPEVVYRRGVITARRVMSEGRPLTEALAVGRARTVSTAATDVTLAQRGQMDAWVAADRIVGYRRVLTGNSCLFCATASTQRYYGSNLAPLHNGCDCGMAPIVGDRDPGQVINKPLLRDLKAKGPEYWKKRGQVDADGNPVEKPAVHTHGELGPVLGHPDHKFSAESDL